MITVFYLLLSFLITQKGLFVNGHARLVDPPSRASAWRFGFKTPVDYNDNGNNCGGRMHQHKKNKGKCGICGDPWDRRKRQHETGGRYATGTIVRSFTKEQVMRVTIDVTSNHRGYMEFSLCPVTSPSKEVTQRCLNRYRLIDEKESGAKFEVDNNEGKHHYYLRLPKNMECKHCVLQWKYIAGNNWGICEDGNGALGCGKQEEFRGCADISIGSSNGIFISPLPTTLEITTKHYDAPKRTQPPSNSIDSGVVISTSIAKKQRFCTSSTKLRKVPGLGKWCRRNCSHIPAFCPPSHCTCSS